MIREPIKERYWIALGICSVAIVVLAYSWLSYRQHQFNSRDTTIPNLGQFIDGLKKIITPNEAGDIWLWEDFKATYGRLFLGLLVGGVLSVCVGIAMGCYGYAEAFTKFPLSFFGKIPPTAMMVVYFVVFGTQTEMFVAMVALGIFPILAQSVCQSVQKDVPLNVVYKAYTLGASTPEVIWNVVYKQVLPRLIESVRLQIGPALIFLIAAEMMVADVGFGYRLRIQSRLLNMNVVYLYLIILGTAGYLIDWVMTVKRRWLCPWYGK